MRGKHCNAELVSAVATAEGGLFGVSNAELRISLYLASKSSHGESSGRVRSRNVDMEKDKEKISTEWIGHRAGDRKHEVYTRGVLKHTKDDQELGTSRRIQ
jgi:hypothetical protein